MVVNAIWVRMLDKRIVCESMVNPETVVRPGHPCPFSGDTTQFPAQHRDKIHSTDALDKPRIAGGALPRRPYAGGIFGPPFGLRDRPAVGFSDQALTKRV